MGMKCVQVPYNVLDRRLNSVGFFEMARTAGVVVFARSAFLQGLLLMSPEAIPEHLVEAVPFVTRFQDICSTHRISPLAGALAYVASQQYIHHVVFGVETLAQLEEILDVSEKISGPCVADLQNAFDAVDERILNPSVWRK
jgi:aryl-alcohol dehydrogenase-like predicted oxidoreductase